MRLGCRVGLRPRGSVALHVGQLRFKVVSNRRLSLLADLVFPPNCMERTHRGNYSYGNRQ